MADDPLLIQDSTADVVVHVARAPRDGEVVLLCGGVLAIHLVEPVSVSPGVGIERPVLVTIVPLGTELIALLAAASLVGQDTLHRCVVEDDPVPRVGPCSVEVLGEHLRVHHLRDLRRGSEAHITRIGYAGLALTATLGRDEDYPEGSTRAVDRAGGGILQDGDVLDIVGRESVHIALRAVDQDERASVGARADGTCTTDVDAQLAVQRTPAITYGEVEARDHPLQCLTDILHGASCQRLGVELRDGSREVDTLLRTIADDDDFLSDLGVLAEHDIEVRAACEGYLLRLHPDEGEDQGGILGHSLEGVFALHAGQCSVRRALDADRDPREGLLLGIGDRPLDGDSLCPDQRRTSQKHH